MNNRLCDSVVGVEVHLHRQPPRVLHRRQGGQESGAAWLAGISVGGFVPPSSGLRAMALGDGTFLRGSPVTSDVSTN